MKYLSCTPSHPPPLGKWVKSMNVRKGVCIKGKEEEILCGGGGEESAKARKGNKNMIRERTGLRKGK